MPRKGAAAVCIRGGWEYRHRYRLRAALLAQEGPDLDGGLDVVVLVAQDELADRAQDVLDARDGVPGRVDRVEDELAVLRATVAARDR